MTMALLKQVLEKNSISDSVHFLSDSGWECNATEMDGIFYNQEKNTIVFTQDGNDDCEYSHSKQWKRLYGIDGLL